MEGAQRTAAIVDGLKRFSVLDGEDRETVPINSLIERAIHWVRTGMKLEFEVNFDPCPGCTVKGNAGQLLQVLMNLIQNAFDAAFRPDGPVPRLLISVTQTESTLEISLHDNGPGIPPEVMSRIFEPFFTTKPVGKGTGLGLSISYGIVERHGGALTALNHPQGGAVFILQLPVFDCSPH